MPPKRVKSGSAPGAAAAGGNKTWESGLAAAQFEEDSWKADISLVVGVRTEDEENIKALVLAVQLPVRRSFTVITWDATLEKIHELGNPKAKKPKDVPVFYEVLESAKAVLDAGEELPAHLLGKVVKFQLLVAKANDLQRRMTEQRAPEEKGKGKSRAGSPSKEKGGAAAKAAGKGEKGKKVSEPPAPAKETKLKRRGEGEETSKCIEDEPVDGPQLYVLMVGFLQPQLVAALDLLGVRVSNIIRVSSASSIGRDRIQQEPLNEPAAERTPTPQDQAAESDSVRVQAQLARFWKYLDPVLSSGPPRSSLWDVSRLEHAVSEERPDPDSTQVLLTFGMRVFEGVACLIYDCLDWRRQHLHYLSCLRLLQVPTVAVARGNAPSRQDSPGQANVRPDPQTPASKRKPVPEESAAVAPPVVTLECDMRYYRDLLDLFPPETVSVPLILHCLREQVVATQEQIPPPSAVRSKPRAHGLDPSLADHMIRAALSLGLSEEEEEKLRADFGVEDCGQQKKELQHPLLFNSQDERSMRLQQLSVHCGPDPVQVEAEMLRGSPLWRSLRCTPPQSETRRLARAQELLHFCTDESLSWAEVEWAFWQFVFESMHLTQEEGRGLGMGVGPKPPPIIPWNDPASFIRQIRTRAAQSTEEHANRDLESRYDPAGSELNKEDGGPVKWSSRVEMADIQGTRVRSLRDWQFAEHHNPSVFPQVLQNACENYRSVDMLHGVQDKAVFLVCHNPMSPERQSREFWDMALHTDVGFRKYLAHVAESISEWTNQEEARRLAQQEEREAERLNAPTPSEHSRASRKRSRGSPRRTTASPVKSPCPEEPAPELHIRQDSLKAWKMEQDRQREEELAKKAKKEKERKSGSKGGDRSPSSRASKKTPSANRRKKQEAQKTPEPAAPPEDGRTEPQLPVEEPRGFTGYSMGGDLIQVWGSAQSLFPSDGGCIRVESTQFIQGSTMVKVCVTKDRHEFFIHVTEPRRDGRGEGDDIVAVEGGAEQDKRPVSKFGSFSAQLENGIRLSYSYHGPSGETAEEKDPTLASVLDIRPPPTPSPVPSSATSRSPSGKRLKSPSKGTRTKGSTPPLVPTEREAPRERETQGTPQYTQGGKEKPALPESSGTFPEQPPLRCLNTCTPHGLLVQFLSARAEGVEGGPQGVMVRQSFPALRQSRGLGGDLTLSLEHSRLITSQGTVIKYLRDSSTQVLFADGTVSSSPDTGPVGKPPPDPPAQEEEVKGQRSEIRELVEKKGKLSSKPSMAATATVKLEGVELSDSDRTANQGGAKQDGPEQGGATRSCDRTWVTTAPSGLRVATTGNRAVQTQPLMACKATDLMTGTVLITREDRVLLVLEEGGSLTVEHADGTRITTFYRETEVPLSADHLETGEEVVTVTRKQKLVKVECEGFVTVMMSCEEGACSAEFGEETVITAHPNGSYQVFPSAGGLLCIDEDGTATYTSHPGHSSAQTPAGQKAELQPGCYTMRHTATVVCEALDPEGNLFQVMVDGETSAVVSSREDFLEEERQEEEGEEDEEEEEGDSESAKLLKFPCVRYKEHSPRFFVVHEDGSGVELLHYSDVEDFLCSANSDPTVAVLKEPIPELQGVWGITVLRPCAKDVWSRWLTPKPSDDIIPTNLRSRRWDTFPARERRTPGPPFGSTLGRGLYLKDRPAPRPPAPLLTCPEVLEVRQLIQYQPISSRLRSRLQRRLQKYLEHLLERELLWEEAQLKEPRTEEEKVHATDLLQLVLSFPDSESPADTMQRRLSTVDVASLYTHSISSVLQEDTVTHLKGPEVELRDSCSGEQEESLWASRIEQYRRELREVEECRWALRNRVIPPYFSSDIYRAFAPAEQVPDMKSLSMELPPFPRQRENTEIQEFHRDAPDPASRRPSNPTPSHAAGGEAPSQERPTNPTPQAAAPPRPPSASGNSHTLRPQTEQDQTPVAPGPRDPIPDHSPQERMCVPVCGPSSQTEGHSGRTAAGHRTWALDVAGNPRKERVRLPSAILSTKPSSRPNQRFLSVEEPVRRKVRTVSVLGSQLNGHVPTPPRGFQLLPAEVDFGVLREGYTYSVTVMMKNVGVDSCRFSVKQPPPATGLKVIYTPGPVAAGMKTDLQVELFAMATGLQDPEEEGAVSYYIQIHTETEILYLPASATVLPGDLYDSRARVGGAKVQVGGAKVRLVSTTPSVQRGVVRPHRRPSPPDEELP
ncbi:sperm-associated antigen 17 isoform X2 [Anguilla anguilla]|uniref:sperm-associated antigen 17 isoform X2 n=1 Tax=Anguilla anguilla TaxID=7936 RepID=UPI0015B31E58|nr:sperm-associated antigen 17 isoform X2 [Anguilla anguilla]